MDTAHVINAISRFTDVRGVPTTITSDNQSSFHAADRELVEWYESIDWDKVRRATGLGFGPDGKGIQWIFNPPVASHFGGIFEIIVKAMKRALKAILQQADLDEEEFRTATSKAMAMLNTRPIQPPTDHESYEPLTPNHFILGDQGNSVFSPDLRGDETRNLQARHKYQVLMQMHLWTRFHEENAPMIAPRTKCTPEQENIRVDDIVVELDHETPRGSWKLMRVSEVYPSEDGLVRKVEIVNAKGKAYDRAACRLLPITRN
jgi:hypothetical protein